MRNFFSENFSVSDSARKILTESLKFRCLSPTLGKKSQKWGVEQDLLQNTHCIGDSYSKNDALPTKLETVD